MKYLTLALAILSPAMAWAQNQEKQTVIPATQLPARQLEDQREDPGAIAIEKLFSSMGQAEFPNALRQAREANVHPQVLLEARFLHLIDMGDDAGLAAMAPELTSTSGSFDPDNSEVFSIKEDWLAIVHYTQALAHLQNGNKTGFKKHITEAFWLSPRQGQAFAPHIDQLRLDEAMASITLDLLKSMSYQENTEFTTLGKLMNGSKATILHFWSPMSQEVQLNLPDFILTTQSCKEQNIKVLSILTGQYPGIRRDAENIRKEDAAEAQCTWLVDSNIKSLADILRVRDIPTMVIVSPDGKILFNGHPSNNKFWEVIQKVAPGFARPNSNSEKINLQE